MLGIRSMGAAFPPRGSTRAPLSSSRRLDIVQLGVAFLSLGSIRLPLSSTRCLKLAQLVQSSHRSGLLRWNCLRCFLFG